MLRLALVLLLTACAPNGEGAIDADIDGHADGNDCNDADPAVFPGADEVCNHVDDDCDGLEDEDPLDGRVFYPDGDGDGYGDEAAAFRACAWAPGYTATGGDCDDADPQRHPGAHEDDCRDTVDYNCDGEVGYTDADFDGYPACEDCDDRDPSSYPGGQEVCDGRDNDCDRTADEEGTPGAFPVWADDDGDTWGDPLDRREACEVPVGFVDRDGDCDDADATIHPEAGETCDGSVDEDCDGLVDDADSAVTGGTPWYADTDGDGHGDPTAPTVEVCVAREGWVPVADDCDDTSADVSPSATEACDALDQDEDCDGLVDDADPSVDPDTTDTYHPDSDGDGFGDAAGAPWCDAPAGWLTDASDCDDSRAEVNPDALEVCDEGSTDENCDGRADDSTAVDRPTWWVDEDGDGFGRDGASRTGCDAPDGYAANRDDCDDRDPTAYPGASDPSGDGIDQDCDGLE